MWDICLVCLLESSAGTWKAAFFWIFCSLCQKEARGLSKNVKLTYVRTYNYIDLLRQSQICLECALRTEAKISQCSSNFTHLKISRIANKVFHVQITVGPLYTYAFSAAAIDCSSARNSDFTLSANTVWSEYKPVRVWRWIMRMSLNESRLPIDCISSSVMIFLLFNIAVYPSPTQLDIEYFRPSKIFSKEVRFMAGRSDSSSEIAFLRRFKQRQSVDILRTEIHSAFVQNVSLQKFIFISQICQG